MFFKIEVPDFNKKIRKNTIIYFLKEYKLHLGDPKSIKQNLIINLI